MKTYTVTGPEALTGEQVASVLSTSLGKRIVYGPISTAEFREFLKGTGESEFVVDAECELFDYWSKGMGKTVTGDIEHVLSRKPVDLASFARRNASELSGP